MFDSDQGTKVYQDCEPNFTITDHRDLLAILGVKCLPDRASYGRYWRR